MGSLILAAGFAGLAVSLLAGDTNGVTLMTLLGVAGLGLGTALGLALGGIPGVLVAAYIVKSCRSSGCGGSCWRSSYTRHSRC